MLNINIPQFVRISKTATDDNPFKIETKEKWLYFADVFILSNSAYLGDIGEQDIPILTNDVYTWLTPINLYELFFKNYTAGSNTKVIVTGIQMTDKDVELMKAKGIYGLKV